MKEARELTLDELKKLVITSRASKFDQGWILEARQGKITIDLTDFENIFSIKIFSKRISGNGATLISNKENIYKHNFLSKLCDIFELNTDSGLFTISRPDYSIGEICIFGISIESDAIQENEVSKKFKLEISKLNSYKSIRLIDGKLFASEGGTLSPASSVLSIETSPSNMFRKTSDNLIKFIGSCEIVELEILGETKATNPIFVHRNGPSKPAGEIKASNMEKQFTPPERTTMALKENTESKIICDSLRDKSFRGIKASNSKLAKYINSNGSDYISIKRSGSCEIPIAALKPYTEYVVVITCKKYSGNGRVYFGLSNGSGTAPQTSLPLISEINFSEHYLILHTDGNLPEQSSHRLHISMPEDCVGEILISRIRITQGVSLEHTRMQLEKKDSKNPLEVPKSLAGFNIQYGSSIEDDSDDPVLISSKKYAKQLSTHVSTEKFLDVKNNLIATTDSSLRWINKISPFFPNVSIYKGRNNIPEDRVLSFGKIGDVVPAHKIWIDVFDNDKVTKSDLSALNNAKVIFSPSQANVNYLSDKVPNVMVSLLHRPLPWLPPDEVSFLKNKDFILAFNRGKDSTRRILESWTDSMPPIVLIGARGKFPDHVIPVNEYVSYEKILYMIVNSKAIVDLPRHNDYVSSFLHLAYSAGIPIVSSNWYVLDKHNCTFVINNDKLGDAKVPAINSLREKIINSLELKKELKDMKEYNKILYSTLMVMSSLS